MEALNHSSYLRLIQKTGSTRHPRGFFATELILKRAGITKDSHILDVGCGAGFTSSYIAKNYGCRVVGVDISPEVLQKASALHKDEPGFDLLTFEIAKASNLPFSDGYFDLVLCESVLFFIEDKKAAIKEMARVVKPGGYLALNEICVGDEPELKHLKEYFQRPEFGGFLATTNDLIKNFNPDAWTMVLEDEETFDLKSQLVGEIKQLINKKGILHLFEIAHQALVDNDVRQDLWRIFKFSLDMPKGTFDHLQSLLLLAQKKG